MFFKKPLISKIDENRLIQAIQIAESKTSGEIRVHIEKTCNGDVIEACKKKFENLNMHQTKDRNAILFYLALESKLFAVWGDKGIHEKVSDQFWNNITDCAIDFFKKNEFITGIEKSVEMCGEKLKLHFPIEIDDKNELPNEISY